MMYFQYGESTAARVYSLSRVDKIDADHILRRIQDRLWCSGADTETLQIIHEARCRLKADRHFKGLRTS